MLTSLLFLAGIAAATPCESLKALTLPNTTIESVQLVPAGPFTTPAPGNARAGAPAAPTGAPGGRGQGGAAPGGGRGQAPGGGATAIVPEHCRVAAVLTPSPDSRIAME